MGRLTQGVESPNAVRGQAGDSLSSPQSGQAACPRPLHRLSPTTWWPRSWGWLAGWLSSVHLHQISSVGRVLEKVLGVEMVVWWMCNSQDGAVAHEVMLS